MIKKPKLKTAIIITSITVAGLYGYGCHLIFRGVETYVRDAQAVYGGEPVLALIALVEDEQASFEQRNSAIWALGQLGDNRALPLLSKLDTDEVQEPPYDSTTSILQYGVEKSIKQIHGFSVVRWMYRKL